MPQKAKFTKEHIIEIALNIVRNNGIHSLTARNIGSALNSSTRPIFTVFNSMEEVQNDVIIAARNLYDSYVEEALKKEENNKIIFKKVGEQYIRFSIAEPKLFQLLFMNEYIEETNFINVLPIIENNYEKIISSIVEQFKLNREDALKLYRHLWVYTHGIASLCATKMCVFTENEIGNMLTEVFTSLLTKIKEMEVK